MWAGCGVYGPKDLWFQFLPVNCETILLVHDWIARNLASRLSGTLFWNDTTEFNWHLRSFRDTHYVLDGTWKRISLPDFRDMSTLEVSPFHGIALLQIDAILNVILILYVFYEWN